MQWPRAVAALILLVLSAAGLHAQSAPLAYEIPSNLRITDARLGAAMQRLLQGSAAARAVVADLAGSGLHVSIGGPTDLAQLASGEGGLLPAERSGLLAPTSAGQDPLAWVMLRVAGSADGADAVAERAWVVVDVAGMIARITRVDPARAAGMLEQDLLATLAHEFVAHVGSIARSRRLADFCDDPTPASQAIDPLGCSVRVENRVRRELNQELHLRGADRLPERRSYSLDAMNFARAPR